MAHLVFNDVFIYILLALVALHTVHACTQPTLMDQL